MFLAITQRLGAAGRTVGIGDEVVDADASGIRLSEGLTLARSPVWPKALAWAFRTGGLFRGKRFAEMIHRARMDEALQDGRSARFVASHGSALVDVLAWAHADFYSGTFDEKGLQQILLYLSGQRRVPLELWPRFIRNAPEVWLLNVFDLAHPPAPDVLVLTKRDAASAMALYRSRGRALEAWQSEAFLARLQDAYGDVAAVLRRRRVEVVELDAADLDVARSADAVLAICRRLTQKGVESLAGGPMPAT